MTTQLVYCLRIYLGFLQFVINFEINCFFKTQYLSLRVNKTTVTAEKYLLCSHVRTRANYTGSIYFYIRPTSLIFTPTNVTKSKIESNNRILSALNYIFALLDSPLANPLMSMNVNQCKV